jgi:hypothetical protein
LISELSGAKFLHITKGVNMVRPTEIKALDKYRIWIRYSDDTEGEVDLSDFAGRGVFTLWDEDNNFQKVSLGAHGEIQWSDEIDLCPDTIYLRLTDKQPDELFPNLDAEPIDA